MRYKNQNLIKYLNDLSAKLAAPGGGSAAALNAAMGASLISMVVNFTLGKPKYFAFELSLKKTLAKSEKLKNDFLELVDLDVAAYNSKDARKALDVSLVLARLCCAGSKLCPQLIKEGNVNLISDVGAAAVFLESAFICACFNARVNLKSLADIKLTAKVSKELNQMYKIVRKIRKDTEDSVGKIIRG